MSAFELVLLVTCLIGSWFFSGMETGLISINRLRLRHFVRRKVKGADTLQYFLDHTAEMLGTPLVGNNLVNTVLSVIAVSIGTRWFGPHGSWMASAAVTLVLLVACEYFPKAWFQSFPTRRCLPFAAPLGLLHRLLLPFGRPLMHVVRTLVPGPRSSRSEAQPVITREELLHLTREGHQSGSLTEAEVRMITGVMDLKSMTCAEIMVPRDKIIYVHHDTTVEDLKLFARARTYHQFPVYHREQKGFIGMLYVSDVLADPSPDTKRAQDYMRPPQLVSRSIPVDHVLPRMRVTRQPAVLVTDEQMEVVGLVTLDDVIAEFVGA